MKDIDSTNKIIRLTKIFNWISLNTNEKNNYIFSSSGPFSSHVSYLETFHLVVTRSTIYHIDLDLPSNSRIESILHSYDIIFVQNTHCSNNYKSFTPPPSVFKLQHHCSKPTSKCSWQRKSIFRLDTFVWKKIASNRFSFPPWIWRVHNITSLKHIAYIHTYVYYVKA